MGLFSKKKVSEVYPVREVGLTTLATDDFVTVIDTGKRYPSMVSWFEMYGYKDIAGAFAPSSMPLDTSIQYQTLAIKPHVSDKSITVAAITEANSYQHIFLIGMTGLSKRNSVNVGNTVRITNAGKCYQTYTAWFDENNLKVLKPYYQKGATPPTNCEYRVLAARIHSITDLKYRRMVVAIVDKATDSKVYLIGIDGLQRV